jgi:NADPH:quinone reductase-like Zn-dependent oxidoreductase
MSLVFAGKLKPVLDRDYPLAQAAAAHGYLEQGSYLGKVTLSIG